MPSDCAESGVEGQPLAEAAHPPQTEQDRAIDAEVLAILADGTTDRQPQVPGSPDPQKLSHPNQSSESATPETEPEHTLKQTPD